MSPEEYEKAVARNQRATAGTRLYEAFSDPKRDYPEFGRLLRGDKDDYKPLYRALSLMLAHEGVWPGASIEEAEHILRCTHRYFVTALDKDRSTFEHLYGVLYDTLTE